ncbi:extracellular solute-binding protein [Streptomyces sp. ACA25]|uniref:extracellular solute-binding protein n=1 Tax=Streptomyces sp. ACA25 TaxID=3022596 RepID=UPI0023072F06|nr:extracellular solute-binding protein [Streptomyces sp. ACA25]MDB1088105.1 extracellular solute-binding protein [Streptomyces sp. ACA25]
MSFRRRSVVALAASALLLSACGGEDSGSSADGKVTIDWWHIGTAEPTKSVYEQWAKDFEAENPGVTVKITSMENEAFKSKMTTLTASGDVPDIFSTWGGGVLSQQVEAGLVADLSTVAAPALETFTTAAISPYKVDDVAYGIPVDAGMVGFWYNKALFADAGIDEPPTTWSGFLDTVEALKESGTTPIALAGKEKWPGHFYWSYLAMRIGGIESLKEAETTHDFTGPGFVEAGERLQELADLDPFQSGFLGADYSTPDGQAAAVGGGRAAMELMGQWAPSVQADTSDGLGDDLGFFTFPEVEGGKGSLDEVLGGGNGFAMGADAPDEAVDFLLFISQAEQHGKLVESGAGLPVMDEAVDLVGDEHLKAVADAMSEATGFQLYLDQAYPPAVGAQVNDSVAELLAGVATPEEANQAISDTAKSEG